MSLCDDLDPYLGIGLVREVASTFRSDAPEAADDQDRPARARLECRPGQFREALERRGLHASDAESTTATRSSGVSAAGPLDTLLAVQAQEDSQDRKRRQARRGHDLLDGLDRLKAALLTGRVLPSELERLRATLSLRRETTNGRSAARRGSGPYRIARRRGTGEAEARGVQPCSPEADHFFGNTASSRA